MHINKIRNERGDITTDTMEILMILRLLWTIIDQWIGKPRKVEYFPEICNLLRVNNEETEYMNRPIMS